MKTQKTVSVEALRQIRFLNGVEFEAQQHLKPYTILPIWIMENLHNNKKNGLWPWAINKRILKVLIVAFAGVIWHGRM